MELGKVLAQSGYFTDAKDANQAIVKVLAGREMGFGPIASMTGIYIVKGKPSMGANLIAAAIKRSGRYDYRVKELTDEVCRIEFFEVIGGKRESIGVSEFTKAQAQKAGTQNMDKFPRNMLFARCMSNGAKWYCADVFGGPVYTPEELGAVVDGETGEVISEGPKWTAPVVKSAETVTDEATGYQPVFEPIPIPDAPAPEQPAQTYRMSKVKFDGMTPDQWHALCGKLAADFPNWQNKQGQPDMNHILASAGQAGYEYITAANVDDVLTTIIGNHAAKQATASAR